MRSKAALRIFVAASITAAVPALAHPQYWEEWKSYSDPDRTNLVGGWGVTCHGTRYSWGTRGPYVQKIFEHDCGNIVGPHGPR